LKEKRKVVEVVFASVEDAVGAAWRYFHNFFRWRYKRRQAYMSRYGYGPVLKLINRSTLKIQSRILFVVISRF
jgi:hypothetical protein